MANNIDWKNWTTNLTKDSAYGAIPPSGVGYEANTVPTITVSDNTGLGGLSGGYTIGATGTSTNTVWTGGSFRVSPDYTAVLTASGCMELKGDGADIDINGKSLKDWMEKVEERLNILTPNPELEKEWDDLRRLGERYRKLEKKCKEKAEVWKKLKSMPKPETKW